MDYYNENAKKFIDETFDANMKEQYELLEKYLSGTSIKLLDIGFGSGRDSLYFKSKGYDVTSIDPVNEFCDHGIEIGLNNVHCMKVQEMTFDNEFNAIWACASLLHIPTYEMVVVLNKCYDALKDGGVMYCSFKNGEFEGERGGRFFLDLIEERFRQFASKTKFSILEVSVSDDVRPERTEKWLNVIMKK